MFATSVYRKNPTSAFSGNRDSGNGYIVKYIQVLRDNPEVGLVANLAKYVKTLQALMTAYETGQYQLVANLLTLPVYNQMSVDLARLAANPLLYPNYETLRVAITSTLTGLYLAVVQYGNLVNAEIQLTSAEDCCSILSDPTRLQDYINKMHKTRNILPAQQMVAPKASIRAEYAEYIKLYGFPTGGAWNMDKLAPLVQKYGSAEQAPIIIPN
jgi:hypothetical protein